MIPQLYRLKIDPHHKFVGRVYRGNSCLCIIRDSVIKQWAVQVSKKIAKLATDRNRLRRQLNHWLYLNRNHIPDRQILIIVKNQDVDAVKQELSEMLFMKPYPMYHGNGK